jgi:hypothetical protein
MYQNIIHFENNMINPKHRVKVMTSGSPRYGWRAITSKSGVSRAITSKYGVSRTESLRGRNPLSRPLLHASPN